MESLRLLTTTYRIAGIAFRIDSDLLLHDLHNSSFDQFRSDDAKPDVVCRVRGVNGWLPTCDCLTEGELKFLKNCVRYPLKDLENPLLCLPSVRARLSARTIQSAPISIEIRDSSLTVFDFAEKELEAFYQADFAQILSRSRIGPGFFAPFLPVYSAAMVHSSALVHRGSAALFLAADGGGKTTLMEHSIDDEILSDDQIVLREEQGVIMAHGTPWGSYVNSNVSAQVGGLFLLEQAERFELIPVETANVLEYLWNEHALYRLLLPQHLRKRTFELFHRACKQAPMYLLRFSKNEIDWHAIYGAMASSIML